MVRDINADLAPTINFTAMAGTLFLGRRMNPVQKLILIVSLAASLITLIAQSVGGDVIALVAAFATSAIAPLILPRLLGMQVIAVSPDEEPSNPLANLRAYTAELQSKCNQEGRAPSDAEVIEAMDQDVKQMQDVVASAHKNPELDRSAIAALETKLAVLIRAREKYKELTSQQ